MSLDSQILEKPIKLATIALLVFTVSSFVLGNAYEFLALSTMGLPQSGSWQEIEQIAGFSIDRAVRYFVFYFICYLAISSFDRSLAKSSPWGALLLFAGLPSVMTFLPTMYTGEFHFTPHWAFVAMLFSLMYVRASGYPTSPVLSKFLFGLMSLILLYHATREASGWDKAMTEMSRKMYLDDGKITSGWFAFGLVAIVSAGVQLYLIYWLPNKFFLEFKSNPLSKQQED